MARAEQMRALESRIADLAECLNAIAALTKWWSSTDLCEECEDDHDEESTHEKSIRRFRLISKLATLNKD